jgi:long-chain fatty acid transport protein
MFRLRGFFCSTTALLAVAAALPVSSAHGSGFGIFTQSASSLGQADAVVAHEDGPSAIFFNPALMTKLPGTQLEAGTTLVLPEREYTALDGTTASTKDEVFYPSTFYATHAFSGNFSAGLGVFNPFGLGIDWGSSWPGRYLVTRSELTTYDINPAVAYRIAPCLTVAAGMDIVLLDATLENMVPSATLGLPGPAFDIKQKFSGNGTGLGYNLGLLLDINDALSLGASYRSEVKVDIHGDSSLSVSPLSFDGSSSVTLPQQAFAGVAYRAMERLTLEAGVRWEDWSSFDRLRIDVAGQPPVVMPRDWHGTFSIDAGGKYRLSDTLSVMAGYLYGTNAVPDSTFEPSIPDADTHMFSVGTELHVDKLRVALAYAYQFEAGRTKTTNQYGPAANGRYDSDAHLVALSLGYRL